MRLCARRGAAAVAVSVFRQDSNPNRVALTTGLVRIEGAVPAGGRGAVLAVLAV